MKVCLLTRYFDFTNGGIGRFSVEILRRIEERGCHLEKISCKHGYPDPCGYFFYTAFEIPVRLPRCDVYHALTPMEGMWIPKDKGIVTFHDLIPWMHPDKMGAGITKGVLHQLKTPIGRGYFRFACEMAKRARFVVCNSQQTRDEVLQHLRVPREKTQVIKLGIRDDLEPRHKPDDVLRFGYLGQLDGRKRVDLVIKAFKAASADGELVIAGIGAEDSALRELAGGDRRIKFLGFVPDDSLVDFYNSLDYFIFPTRIEGYGLPIVEAMACRKPVVVLEDAIIPSEIKSRCTAVSRLEDFFSSLSSRCDLEENYRFAKEHRWDRCVKAYEELYHRIYQKA